jgi:hypothetical protein
LSFDRLKNFDATEPVSAETLAWYARHLDVERRLGIALGWTDLEQVGEVWRGGFPPEWFESFPSMPRGCGCFLPLWTRNSADSFHLMTRFGLYPSEIEGMVRVLSPSIGVLATAPLRDKAGSVDKAEAVRFVIAEAVLAWLDGGGELKRE